MVVYFLTDYDDTHSFKNEYLLYFCFLFCKVLYNDNFWPFLSPVKCRGLWRFQALAV